MDIEPRGAPVESDGMPAAPPARESLLDSARIGSLVVARATSSAECSA